MFGNELARAGATDIDHRYRGEQLDPNTGFYNLRARWYDPNVGRFTSMDSWSGSSQDPISLHRYLYAASDPISFSDPSGQFSLAETSMSLTVAGLVNASIGVAMNALNPSASTVWGDVGRDFVVGAAFAPVGGVLARVFGPILQTLAVPMIRIVGAMRPLLLSGRPAMEKFLINISRALFTSTKGYPSVQSTLIGRTLKMLFPAMQWEQHHIFIQQCWSRVGSSSQLFDDLVANQGLRRLGNGGWNLMPIPRALNSYLGQSEVATQVFATFMYSVAVFGPYQTFEAVESAVSESQ